MFCKKRTLKDYVNSQANTCTGVFFLIKLKVVETSFGSASANFKEHLCENVMNAAQKMKISIKGYKTITSQNVLSEAQVKNSFVS